MLTREKGQYFNHVRDNLFRKYLRDDSNVDALFEWQRTYGSILDKLLEATEYHDWRMQNPYPMSERYRQQLIRLDSDDGWVIVKMLAVKHGIELP